MKKPTSKYYVVWNGREIGIFKHWHECEPLVKGFPNCGYKSAQTLEDALKLLKSGLKARGLSIHDLNVHYIKDI